MALGKCKNCKFWDKYQNVDIGECKRHPPSVFTRGVKNWRYPETKNNDECGEFEQEGT